MSEAVYGGIGGEDEVPSVGRLLTHAFAMHPEGAADWMRTAGLDNVRVLREGRAPVAAFVRVPMGQFFGGRSVSMLGVSAVAVAPEARGRGLARKLMNDAVTEMHQEGWATSCLYPSTQTLYRQIGYEQAGYRFFIRLSLAHIDVRERSERVIPLDESHRSAIEDCYRVFASAQPGWLDRGAFSWSLVRERRGERYHGFGIESAAGLDGYVFLSQQRKPESGRYDVVVSDVAFRTAAAGRRLLGFLSDYATIGDELVVAGGPHHPLLWLVGQQRYTLSFKNYWMIRLTDVAKAFEERGYAPSVRASVSLDLTDSLIGANSGRWLLEIEGGRARVRRGGEGTVRLDVRSLAALWSGFATPEQLRLLGCIEGPEGVLAELGGAFAGGTPAMTDMF